MKPCAVFCLVVFVTACASGERQDPAALLSTVDASDGVTRGEADTIAEAYFAKHVGCGAYSGISNGDASWVVEGKHGFGGDPIKGFLIDKKTGQITSTVGPSYAHPNDMLKEAQPAVPADGPRAAREARR
jgi:hypothetical protein